MTSQAIAELLQARPAGRKRWTAKCPGHEDRSPSLSIREGEDGRTLVHCFAGCSVDAILTALRLKPSDLYPGPMPSPAEQEALRLVREWREHQRREKRKAHASACDRIRKWEAIRDALGAKLMLSPESDALAIAFDRALVKLREAEEAEEALRGVLA